MNRKEIHPLRTIHADTDGDYIFNTDNELFRIQADKPISDMTYEDMWSKYRETEA